MAHSGVLESVLAGAGPGRFSGVARRAAALLGGDPLVWPSDASARLAGRARLYGGFAFRDDHRATGAWSSFPPGLFHLPDVELEGDAGGGARLRVRGWLEDDEAAVRARLEARAAELAARLEAAPDEVETPPTRPSGGPAFRGDEAHRAAWERAVGEVLDAIAAGRVSKVVLARTLDVAPEPAVDAVDVLAALRDENRGSHVFLFEPSPGRVLLGAAPETVATLRSGVFHATAVAGSIARGRDDAEDRALAARLLASAKDREEHHIALQDMLERLAPLAESVEADAEPHVLTLPRIQHLETELRARVGEGPGVLTLLAELHPTPAVCGLPRDAALELIREEEPFDRGWYAGPVGWVDGEGNGVFAPALRSAVTHEGGWRLFAGAGIVAGSRPSAEWEETGIKFEPVLRALAAAGAGAGPAA